MERTVHIAKSFEEAVEWDFQQNISMTPEERLDILQRLREEYYIFKTFFHLSLLLFSFFLSYPLAGQGPTIAYYYHPSTELSWAQCYVYLEGGSKQKIPFLPVVNLKFHRAPLGIDNYSKDINVNGNIVFIGNGIVKNSAHNSYWGRRSDYSLGDIDVTGKIVMFCYDFPDKVGEQWGKKIPLTKRIAEASFRKAAAVVLFSYKKEYPFLGTRYEKKSDIPGIPAISITKKSAENILNSAGINAEALFKKWQETGEPSQSMETISKLNIKIKGNFHRLESQNFLVRFRKELINTEEIKQLIDLNEKSLNSLFECFKEDKQLKWKKSLTVYFRYFDSKLFYTHHWGHGLACAEGTFNIFYGEKPAFDLAVHENAHRLINSNWNSSSSFMDEGLAQYAEAQADDKDKNHLATIEFLKQGKLFPLEKMVTFNIGSNLEEAEVAYPASGSFIGFLIKKYGLESVKKAYGLERRSIEEKQKENTWQKVYDKPLDALEKEWRSWLMAKYK